MLKFASKLPTDVELALVYCGQSNARPWGTKEEAYAEDQRFSLASAGLDLALDNDYPVAAGQSLYSQRPGATTALMTTTSLTSKRWEGAHLCLGVTTETGVGLRYGVVGTNWAAGSSTTQTTIVPVPASNTLTLNDHRIEDGAPLAITPGTGCDIPEATYFAEKVDDDAISLHLTVARATGGVHQTPVATSVGTTTTLVRAAVSGTATSGSATTLVDSGASWTVDEHVGRRVEITGGTGADTYKVLILANTATTLTVSAWKDDSPDVTSTYTIEWRDDELIGCTIEFVRLNGVGVAAGVEVATITDNDGTTITFGAVSSATAIGDVAVIYGRPASEQFTSAGSTATTFYYPIGWITVTWGAGTAITHGDEAVPVKTAGWVVHEDERWKAFRTVRVLTPYTPEQEGASPTTAPVLPGGYTKPAAWTSFDDMGLFLDHTFIEGVEAPGFFDDGLAAGAANPTASSIDATSMTVNEWAGAHVRVKSYDDGVLSAVSYGTVLSNTASTLTLTSAGWTGGTPGATVTGTATYDVEVFLPHGQNNPHAVTAGEGFRHPNNDPMPTPFSANNGKIHLRHKDVQIEGYGNRFGAMLVTAYQLSAMIGRRVNVIHLGINSAGLFEQYGHNSFGYPGTIGWWNPDDYLDWTPARSNGSFARLSKMITEMAPNALTAEGNTKKLAVMGIVYYQGEADAIEKHTRARYKNALPSFVSRLREVIDDAGVNLFSSADKIPFVQPVLPTVPWVEGSITYEIPVFGPVTVEFSNDTEALVNTAIKDFAAKDPFAGKIETEGRTKLGETSLTNGADPLHFDGKAEVLNGLDVADTLVDLIDEAYAADVDWTDNDVVQLCNSALNYIGSKGKFETLDPLTVTSPIATYCRDFFVEARDMLLERQAWAFATTRVDLDKVTDFDTDEWVCAYGVPPNAAKVFAVLPPASGGDYHPKPQPFTVETDQDGHEIILTNQASARARYNLRVNTVAEWSANFRNAFRWLLASLLAGPIIKGAAGASKAAECVQFAEKYLGDAGVVDAHQEDDEQPEEDFAWDR